MKYYKKSHLPGAYPLFLACTILLLAMYVYPRPLCADMANQFGISSRAIAMGNAYTALADDYSGFYYNPAGLATVPRDVFSLGYIYTSPRVRVQELGGPERLAFTSNIKGGMVGFQMDVGQFLSERFRRNVVMGLTAVFPDNFKTYVNADTKFYDELEFPVFGRVHDFALMVMGGALELHRMLYLGASVRLAFTADIRDITILYDVTDFKIDFEKLDINADTEIQPIVGLLFMPSERVRIGAAWRKGGSPVHFIGAVNVTVDTGFFDLPLPPFSCLFLEFYTPEETALSIAYRLSPRLLMAVEATYAQWSAYDVPYSEKPPGRPMRDIVIPKIGLEYGVHKDVKVRLGYYYHPSPVRSHQPYTYLLDTDQHVFSTGLGYTWRYIERLTGYPLECDLHFQYQYLPRRTLHTLTTPTDVWGYIVNVGGSVQFRF